VARPLSFSGTNNLITWAIDTTDCHHVVHRVMYVYAYARTRYCASLYTYTYMIVRRLTDRVKRTTTRASQSPSCHGSRSLIYHDTLATYVNNVTRSYRQCNFLGTVPPAGGRSDKRLTPCLTCIARMQDAKWRQSYRSTSNLCFVTL
jgi:hypothetical protein